MQVVFLSTSFVDAMFLISADDIEEGDGNNGWLRASSRNQNEKEIIKLNTEYTFDAFSASTSLQPINLIYSHNFSLIEVGRVQ